MVVVRRRAGSDLQAHQHDGPHGNGDACVHQHVERLANRWDEKENLAILLDGLIVDFGADVFQGDGQDVEERENAEEHDGRRFIRQTRTRENEQTECIQQYAGANQ